MVRIGCGAGFGGDRLEPAVRLLEDGALDYLVFTNIDRLASRLNPASLVVSEVVFGILLTAVAVQLVVFGLRSLGIVEATAAAH